MAKEWEFKVKRTLFGQKTKDSCGKRKKLLIT